MMATLEREDVLVCDKCLDAWSPKHWSHGAPVDQAEMIRRWREEIQTSH
jgi:hypothetical protein